MVQKINLNSIADIIDLHDYETASIEYADNRLSFVFENKVGDESNNFNRLKVHFVLGKSFSDEDFVPSVRHIKKSRFFNKSTVKYYNLGAFLEYLTKNKYGLKFYSIYYNKNQCLLITELIKDGKWEMFNEFDIELCVEEIICEYF